MYSIPARKRSIKNYQFNVSRTDHVELNIKPQAKSILAKILHEKVITRMLHEVKDFGLKSETMSKWASDLRDCERNILQH